MLKKTWGVVLVVHRQVSMIAYDAWKYNHKQLVVNRLNQKQPKIAVFANFPGYLLHPTFKPWLHDGFPPLKRPLLAALRNEFDD